ncbi:adenosylcobinamide amidohydrolase, partial [Paenibacillus sepulcri]|nr:adenosylcobinamide amidohydrolase [Paenibacillus sepulcri]
MTQPFRSADRRSYLSECWREIQIRHEEDAIIITCARPLETISSAVLGGGFSITERIINWKVPLAYDCSDPVHDLHMMLSERGYPPQSTVGMLTAAKLTHASITEMRGDEFTIVCCTTAGTS